MRLKSVTKTCSRGSLAVSCCFIQSRELWVNVNVLYELIALELKATGRYAKTKAKPPWTLSRYDESTSKAKFSRPQKKKKNEKKEEKKRKRKKERKKENRKLVVQIIIGVHPLNEFDLADLHKEQPNIKGPWLHRSDLRLCSINGKQICTGLSELSAFNADKA